MDLRGQRALKVAQIYNSGAGCRSMKSIIFSMLIVLMVPMSFFLGRHFSDDLSRGYSWVFPEPEFRVGDFASLYAWADSDVVMFSDSSCPFCTKTRELLTAERVEFKELLIDQSAEAKAEFLRRGGVGVPMLFVGDRLITGYRESAIREAVSLIP